MAKRINRTDPHRPGAIIASNYRLVLSYNLPTSCDGWPVPGGGVNCEIERRTERKDPETGKTIWTNGEHRPDGRCCIVALRRDHRFAATGGTGKCSICGACYVYGDVWQHEPTGELIHVGHDCADKYSMLADRTEFELGIARAKRTASTQAARALKAKDRADFLAAHDGLAAELETDHPIVRDIAQRFQAYCAISDKQIALVRKLAAEIRNPAPAEVFTDAPKASGRITFRGRVLAVKLADTAYGDAFKITVKVETEQGAWLAWGTCPALLIDAANHAHPSEPAARALRGATVEITAALKPGREPHFALLCRPAGKIVTWPTAEAAGY